MVQAPVEECSSIASNDDRSDLPQALILLGEMNVSVQHVASLVDNMIQRVRNGEMSTDQGLSFLEMKYNMLLSYLINLTYVVLKKCTGTRSVDPDPCVERLVEIRTVLEKIKPIDNKLKYQIDKLVKSNLTSNKDDETRWKANPEEMDAANGGEDEEEMDADETEKEDDSSKNKKKAGIYVPPKISAVHYDAGSDDDNADRDGRRSKTKINRLKLSASIMQDLRDEYLDTPIEEGQGNAAQSIISKRQREKQEYEETYMTRLPVTKEEKRRNKKIRNTVGQIGDELTSFMYSSSSGSGNKKRKSTGGGGKKKGKNFKRRRTH